LEELRYPSVSGNLYPVDKIELDSQIVELLSKDATKSPDPTLDLKAAIIPHSGYDYSGEVMAAAYKMLNGESKDEVFILANSYFHEISKTAFSDFRYWQTPLGKIEQSHRITQIVGSDDVASQDLLKMDTDRHHGEYTIEVQLPFLQTVLSGDFRIIPILLGSISPRLLGRELNKIVDPDDLIIVSAELSHGFPDEYAEDIDKQSIEKIISGDIEYITADKTELVNKSGIASLVHLSKLRGWTPYLLKYSNVKSQDDASKSNGYVAIGYFG
jgi:AmmeMemoRadiSam system protein B